MTIHYESFKRKSWHERIEIFNAVSAEDKADLVRTHVSWWLETHRRELTPQQIAILEENIAAIVPSLYLRPRNEELPDWWKELEKRTAALLTGDQRRQALTMHWKPGEWD